MEDVDTGKEGYHWIDPIETPMIVGLLLMVAGIYTGYMPTALSGSLVILGAAALNLLFGHGAKSEREAPDIVHGI
jgi:hypothetical protein